MTVVLARIDQRLIHGLIVNQWAQYLKIKRFMVVDDELSKNESIKSNMRMTKPAGTGMSIINTKKAIHNFGIGKYDEQRVFILVKEPEVLIQLVKAGIKIPKIDLGILFDENGRKPISKFVFLNAKEKQDLMTLKNMGIPVVIQYVPTDPEKEYIA
ncbi:PTS sugar transporter subunit IIB [uncultured Lactobacillus sp.]|uniref:PTS sugar transporter subunit IIB n=1 Tax=uncultured Lactobacillus sp. TaxID=153152 RepID=UPI0025FE2428|nr:PTS sugar transporter subunit IIB [uncultured Lactobacillus sp.]